MTRTSLIGCCGCLRQPARLTTTPFMQPLTPIRAISMLAATITPARVNRSFLSSSPVHRSLVSSCKPSSSSPSLSSSSILPATRLFSSLATALEEWKSFNSSGLAFLNEGKFREAELQFISALRSSQSLVKEGSAHSSVPLYLALSNLSSAQRHLGKLEESQSNAQYALDHVKGMEEAVGVDVLAHLHRELGLTCEMQNKWQEAKHNYTQAEQLYRQRIQQLQSDNTPTSPPPSPSSSPSPSTLPHLLQEHAGTLFALALSHEKLNQPSLALSFYQQAVGAAVAAYGADTVNAAEAHVALGRLMVEEGERGEGGEGLRMKGGEELMKALEIYQKKKDRKLLEVLPLYMRSLGVKESMEDIMKGAEVGGGAGEDTKKGSSG